MTVNLHHLRQIHNNQAMAYNFRSLFTLLNSIGPRYMSSFKSNVQLGVIKLAGLLPLPAARCIGTALGWLSAYTASRNTKVTQANIKLCFPALSEEAIKQKVKESLIHTAILPFETSVVWSRPKRWVDNRIVGFTGLELIKKAVSSNEGVLLIAPHLGNWEVLGTQAVDLGELTSMYQPPKQAFLDSFIYKKRKSYAMKLAPTNTRGVAQCLKALKKGGLVAILPDQNPAQAGEFAPFFGRQTYTMTLIHRLIQRTSCKVMYGFAKRVKGGFHIHYIEPYEEIYSNDSQVSLTALNKGIERCVEHCPSQYQWEYKRFKQRPVGDKQEYYKKRS